MGYRLPPTPARRVGFELAAPSEVELSPSARGAALPRARTAASTIGELEITVFRAALVIDRDGILEEKVREGIEAAIAAGARVLEAVPVRARRCERLPRRRRVPARQHAPRAALRLRVRDRARRPRCRRRRARDGAQRVARLAGGRRDLAVAEAPVAPIGDRERRALT